MATADLCAPADLQLDLCDFELYWRLMHSQFDLFQNVGFVTIGLYLEHIPADSRLMLVLLFRRFASGFALAVQKVWRSEVPKV